MADENNREMGWPERDAMQNTVTLTADEIRERGRRNLVIGGALLAFVVLTFFVTMAKLATNFGA